MKPKDMKVSVIPCEVSSINMDITRSRSCLFDIFVVSTMKSASFLTGDRSAASSSTASETEPSLSLSARGCFLRVSL